MSRIDIGEVHAFLYQLKRVNETGKKEIRAIKTVVTDYVDEASLKGKAIDASKRYYQATYFSLCDALIEAMDESEERLAQYIRDFQEEVDSSLDTKIDADGLYELGKMIDRIEGKKEALAQQMNSGSEGTMQNYRSQLAAAYKEEDILEKYISFEQGHGNFFDTLTDLVQSVLRMVNELGSNIQFNSQTGTYDMSKLDIQSLERMRQALDKVKGNEATFNFDDYQITLNGTTHLLWKNGKVDAEATEAYNEAKLNGKLPKEGNAATQEAELLKGILASLKNKKDPITGQSISKAQSFGILTTIIFSYTTKRYLGKKLRIPNPDKGKNKGKDKEIFKNGRLNIKNESALVKAFDGKSTEEIAEMLRKQGYEVTGIRNSTRSSSGAQIIEIKQKSGQNISQVQVSPGGGRHGDNPYIKISLTDNQDGFGKVKIIHGSEKDYKGKLDEKSKNIFTEED
ncbi:T7SS effector LXG polymorphic toxin [Listeria seeligeri]|uniref:T7SS effector LXG polymorphic toxin n=1 Tax=Listeria seeligeri TaxID=1640 RepID=UPI0022EBC8AA|nr:T7SS effector LXG polymorphic toxin [Listeria seeligeri]